MKIRIYSVFRTLHLEMEMSTTRSMINCESAWRLYFYIFTAYSVVMQCGHFVIEMVVGAVKVVNVDDACRNESVECRGN